VWTGPAAREGAAWSKNNLAKVHFPLVSADIPRYKVDIKTETSK